MTQSEREETQVERAEQIHKMVMAAMAREKPGDNTYTWRDRYLTLFHDLWDRPMARNIASNHVEGSGADNNLQDLTTPSRLVD